MPISNDTFSEWATTRQIEPIIGIRERTLYRLRQSGVLQKGKHYRLKNPLNPKSHILYHVSNVIAELTRTDLEKTLIETDNAKIQMLGVILKNVPLVVPSV